MKPDKKKPASKKPTASLDIEGYYSCSRDEAKELFQPFILLDGMYLVRPSESQGALYTLSVTKDHKVYNYRIQQEEKTKSFLIQDRAEKFGNVPLLIQAYKEKPINPQLNVKLVAPLVQGTKRKQNSQAFLNNYSKTQKTATDDIPGLHRYLPRSEIKNVMEAYMHRPGTFLLRPSLTSEESLTLTVVHKYELLHFKITQNQNTKEVCVASKKFANFSELLEFYKYNPLKIRSRPNDNVLLTFPLPVDKHLENIHKQAQDELYSELAGVQPLPEGWSEHFDEKHQKNYYYNSATKETKWSRPLPAPPPPPSRPSSASSNVATNAPALPARRSLKASVSAPVVPPPRRDTFSVLPVSSTVVEDSTYIEPSDLSMPGTSDIDEDNYIAVESPTSKLPPVPEDDAHPQLRRVSSAPTAGKAPIGAKRMSVIKGDKKTMKEEKELMKQQKQEDKQRVLKEKEEKREAARKAKEEAKRLKAEEAQRKKDEAKRLKEEARQKKEELKRQKEEENKAKEERLQRTLSLSGPPRQNEEENLHRTLSTGAAFSPSSGSGPPPPPSHVDLDPKASQTSPLTSPPKPGAPPPPPRVDLDPTAGQISPLTSPPKPGPPPPPPRVDLDPTAGQASPLTSPTGSGPPPAPTPPPLTGAAAQTAEIKDDKQTEKARKAAEKQKKQEEQRLKKEAVKREKEEAKRKKEEEKRERRMSKSKSITKSVAVEPKPVTEEQPTPKGNVPPPPPLPPIGGVQPLMQSSATTDPTSTDPVLTSSSPIKPLLPSAGKDVEAVSVPAPPPPPAAFKPLPPPPAFVPAPSPLPAVSVPAPPPPPAASKPPPSPPVSISAKPPPASAPAPPPPPPVTAPAPPPPPPISPLPTSSNPASPKSSGFSADDLIAGKSKLTTAAPIEKPTQQAGGLGGLMQSAFDQFNDKIGAMRSFVEYSDIEDYEELEDDEDWD